MIVQRHEHVHPQALLLAALILGRVGRDKVADPVPVMCAFFEEVADTTC
jgi:hypothetical protein